MALPALVPHPWPLMLSQVVAVRSAGEAAVSLSPSELCVLASGGAPRLTFVDREAGDMAALQVGPC